MCWWTGNKSLPELPFSVWFWAKRNIPFRFNKNQLENQKSQDTISLCVLNEQVINLGRIWIQNVAFEFKNQSENKKSQEDNFSLCVEWTGNKPVPDLAVRRSDRVRAVENRWYGDPPWGNVHLWGGGGAAHLDRPIIWVLMRAGGGGGLSTSRDCTHWENYIYISFRVGWGMIVGASFRLDFWTKWNLI